MRRIMTVLAIVSAVVGAAGGGAGAAAGAVRPRPQPAAPGLPLGAMPTKSQQASVTPTTAINKLHYYGGPVVSHAHVVPVEWATTGGTFAYQSQLVSYFPAILHSPYLSWWREYDTPSSGGTGQHIGYGDAESSTYMLAPTNPSDHTIDDDTQIEPDLLANIADGTLPAPTTDAGGHSNTIYAIHFPAQDTISFGTSTSGLQFCAYHDSTTAGTDQNGNPVIYLVLPDWNSPGIGTGGCGSSPSAVDNVYSVASHELNEAINDPDINEDIQTVGAPMAWYCDQSNCGEGADICSGQQATVTTDAGDLVAQKTWSNSQGACLVSRTEEAPSAPDPVSAVSAAGGEVDVSWPEPFDGYSPITSYDIYRSPTAGVQGGLVTSVTGASTSYSDHPPADGTYHYSVVAHNSGFASTVSAQGSGLSDATPPTVQLTSPTSAFTLGSTAGAHWSGNDAGSGLATYDVRYVKASWDGGFGAPSSPSGWLGTTATSTSLSVTPGKQYCFQVRARDHADNLSGWATRRCTSAVLDDRAFPLASHWARKSSSSDYKGTTTKTSTAGAALSLAGVQLTQVELVVTKCSACGRVRVYAGSHVLGTVDTHASGTRHKVGVVLPAVSLRTATIKLKALDDGKPVVIDGLGVSRV